MNGEDTNKFLIELKPHIDTLQRCISNLNINLTQGGYEPLLDRQNNTIERYFTDNPKGIGILADIERAIISASEVAKEFENYRTHQYAAWQGEQFKTATLNATLIAHDREKRKAERRDLWTLWLHQTARWVAGAALVVVMYSGAVWLSAHYPFFHVPIKDWLPDHKAVVELPKT